MNLEPITKHIPKMDWINDISARVRKGEIWQYSTFVTYYVLLTTFPLIVGIINWLQQLTQGLAPLAWFVMRIAPQPLAEQIIQDMMQIYESSNVGVLLIATVSTIWTVSWTMASTLMGLNRAYGVSSRKNIVVLRILAFLLTFLFAAWITVVVFIIQNLSTTSLGRWSLFVPLAFLTFSFLYYMVPNVVQRFRNVIPGALFSTASLLIAIIGYRLFINQLPEDSTFFTMTGSFMVLLALLQKLALAILAGGAINATFMQMREGTIIAKGENSKFVKFLKKLGLNKLLEIKKQ
ncbi:MAG: YihY/virulence factor BrkB family protein [Alkalibacterium sp.]|nr:YihY/virulence factor BrkB family protein [Alkalibacterium sp.]